MANVDAAFGLRPLRHLNGLPWNGLTMKCYVNSANAIYPGCAVDIVAPADTTGVAPTVDIGTAGDGNKLFGVMASRYSPTRDDYVYRPASTTEYINVVVDPSVIYLIQASGTVTYKMPGANNNLASNGGSTVTGLSTAECSTTAAENASNQLWMLGLHDAPDNDIASANSKWECLINFHWLVSVTTNEGHLGITSA